MAEEQDAGVDCCPICKQPYDSVLAPRESRNAHVTACLLRNSGAEASSSATASDRLLAAFDQREPQKEALKPAECPTCRRNLTNLNAKRREVHVNRCIGEDTAPPAPRVLCSECQTDVARKSRRQLLKHIKDCVSDPKERVRITTTLVTEWEMVNGVGATAGLRRSALRRGSVRNHFPSALTAPRTEDEEAIEVTKAIALSEAQAKARMVEGESGAGQAAPPTAHAYPSALPKRPPAEDGDAVFSTLASRYDGEDGARAARAGGDAVIGPSPPQSHSDNFSLPPSSLARRAARAGPLAMARQGAQEPSARLVSEGEDEDGAEEAAEEVEEAEEDVVEVVDAEEVKKEEKEEEEKQPASEHIDSDDDVALLVMTQDHGPRRNGRTAAPSALHGNAAPAPAAAELPQTEGEAGSGLDSDGAADFAQFEHRTCAAATATSATGEATATAAATATASTAPALPSSPPRENGNSHAAQPDTSIGWLGRGDADPAPEPRPSAQSSLLAAPPQGAARDWSRRRDRSPAGGATPAKRARRPASEQSHSPPLRSITAFFHTSHQPAAETATDEAAAADAAVAAGATAAEPASQDTAASGTAAGPQDTVAAAEEEALRPNSRLMTLLRDACEEGERLGTHVAADHTSHRPALVARAAAVLLGMGTPTCSQQQWQAMALGDTRGMRRALGSTPWPAAVSGLLRLPHSMARAVQAQIELHHAHRLLRGTRAQAAARAEWRASVEAQVVMLTAWERLFLCAAIGALDKGTQHLCHDIVKGADMGPRVAERLRHEMRSQLPGRSLHARSASQSWAEQGSAAAVSADEDDALVSPDDDADSGDRGDTPPPPREDAATSVGNGSAAAAASGAADVIDLADCEDDQGGPSRAEAAAATTAATANGSSGERESAEDAAHALVLAQEGFLVRRLQAYPGIALHRVAAALHRKHQQLSLASLARAVRSSPSLRQLVSLSDEV